MKLVFQKEELLRSINIALRAVPSHTTMPVLECIMINAIGSRIRFTTNDTELGIETIVPGIIEEEGSAAVQAKLFSEIVRRLPQENVVLETKENGVVNITSGKSKMQMVSLDGSDFLYLPVIEKEDFVTISQFSLKEVIRQTIFSIAPNDNNPILTGMLFEITGDRFKVVSLDGHRISIRSMQLKESYSDKKVIVPGKTLTEISKILNEDTDDLIHMYFTANHIVFEMTGTTVVSRLIEGEYFNIRNMITKDFNTKIKVNRKDFLSSIDRSSLFVRENDKKPIIFDIEDGFMRLSIESTFGAMDEEIDIDKEGKDLAIGFNPKFLSDALRVIDDETVSVYFINQKAPCFIKNEEEDYMYIILPVNFVR